MMTDYQKEIYEKRLAEVKNDKNACLCCVDDYCRYRDEKRGYCIMKAASIVIPQPTPCRVYSKETILEAIKKEGLSDDAWGYKGDTIYIYEDAMEDDTIWDKLPTPIEGWEITSYDSTKIEKVKYFALKENVCCGYTVLFDYKKQ